VILMAGLGPSKEDISFLSGDFVPIVLSEPFFTYRASMMVFQPDLKTSETEKMPALC
jgi:hypothetical protein